MQLTAVIKPFDNEINPPPVTFQLYVFCATSKHLVYMLHCQRSPFIGLRVIPQLQSQLIL